MRAADVTETLRRKALALGFDRFGVAPVQPVPELDFFPKWLQQGFAADMHYLERHTEKRLQVQNLVPNARSVIVCAKNYHTPAPLSTDPAPATAGWISRYAWGDDYHDLLKKKIRALFELLQDLTGGTAQGRYYVDTGPVLERVWAKYAGIGWIGKNTCVIDQRLGSFFFLAVIVTDAALAYATPPPDRCGTCTRCIDACPTNAILMPYVLDASRCISYLTIERRDSIPEALRPGMSRHLFGCDICQDVCPWNRKAPVTDETAFQPRAGAINPDLAAILSMDEDAFRARFRKSPVKRAKWRGLLRNALVAAGNSGARELLPYVERWLQHEDDMMREHARWAWNRLGKDTGTKLG